MKVRKSVFGSAYERALYKALVTRWSDKLRIYPNLPFFNIIEVDASDVPPNERNFLLKTSVDYTLCDHSDQPLLSIEFDGIGEGFSREGEYVPRQVSSKAPNREWKFNLKLRVCQQLGYPLFILSYEEATPIGSDINLAVVDGIIGKFLAHQDIVPRLNELLKDRGDYIEDLPEWERDEYFQDLVVDAELDAEYEWNPIVQQTAKYRTPLYKAQLYKGHSTEWLEDPNLPYELRASSLFGRGIEARAELLRRRVDALRRAERVGCRVTVNTTEGPFSETVWVRNVEGPGVPIFALAENMAELLVYKQVAEALLPDHGGEPRQK